MCTTVWLLTNLWHYKFAYLFLLPSSVTFKTTLLVLLLERRFSSVQILTLVQLDFIMPHTVKCSLGIYEHITQAFSAGNVPFVSGNWAGITWILVSPMISQLLFSGRRVITRLFYSRLMLLVVPVVKTPFECEAAEDILRNSSWSVF